jgi:hypothetical protein
VQCCFGLRFRILAQIKSRFSVIFTVKTVNDFGSLLIKKRKYSETQLKQTAWDCPNLFVISGVRNNQEIKSLNQAEPKQ